MAAGHRVRHIAALAALAAAAPSLLVVAAYRRDLDRAYARISTGSRVVATACGPIEYAIAGRGPPVLAVHGAGGGFDQGTLLGEALAHRGFRIIAMSRFGYLRTPLPADASASAQADAHACLLDALGIERVAVFGASAGAPSSLQFALRHPRRTSALILMVPAVYAPRPGGAPSLQVPSGTTLLFDTALRSDFAFWAATRLSRRTMIRAILATLPEVADRAGGKEQERVARVLGLILPIVPRRPGLLNDAAVTSTLPRYELEHIATPTLLISAADDLYGTWDGARYSARHLPHARFVGYPDGGHLLVGHNDAATGEIAGFLQAEQASSTPALAVGQAGPAGNRPAQRFLDRDQCGRGGDGLQSCSRTPRNRMP